MVHYIKIRKIKFLESSYYAASNSVFDDGNDDTSGRGGTGETDRSGTGVEAPSPTGNNYGDGAIFVRAN